MDSTVTNTVMYIKHIPEVGEGDRGPVLFQRDEGPRCAIEG